MVTKEQLDSAIIQVRNQFMKELAKVDNRATTVRKEIDSFKEDTLKELDNVRKGLTTATLNMENKLKEANKSSKLALGEITYLSQCFEDITGNIDKTIDKLEERFKPLMDFAETLQK